MLDIKVYVHMQVDRSCRSINKTKFGLSGRILIYFWIARVNGVERVDNKICTSINQIMIGFSSSNFSG